MLVYIVLHVNNLLLSVPSFLSKVRTSQRILTHLQGQFAFYVLFFFCFFLGSILLHTVLELHDSLAETLSGREEVASGYCEYR